MATKPKRAQRCPTCQGRVWNVRLGVWVATRETVDMSCRTCGRDYSTLRWPAEMKEGKDEH